MDRHKIRFSARVVSSDRNTFIKYNNRRFTKFELFLLVKTNNDITLDTGSQVDLGLEVELDAEQKSGILELAIVVGSALDDLA
ncbi:unnamed protein product [Clonostachys byssicola]|uniref:Uncharacterized protein n=1 Tax=Clonostachys byssicola TaxID=160290 RepID=A0A9N9XXU3_9HYPO|nr:unnamed protein product [Clonostachys byssicola]